MIKGKGVLSGVLGIFGAVFLNMCWLSLVIQGLVVLVQSLRFERFYFVGGWTWLGSTIGVGVVGLILFALSFMFFSKKWDEEERQLRDPWRMNFP